MNETTKGKIVEVLEGAHYNLNNIPTVGTGIIPLIRAQIETAIKEIDPDWEPVE